MIFLNLEKLFLVLYSFAIADHCFKHVQGDNLRMHALVTVYHVNKQL